VKWFAVAHSLVARRDLDDTAAAGRTVDPGIDRLPDLEIATGLHHDVARVGPAADVERRRVHDVPRRKQEDAAAEAVRPAAARRDIAAQVQIERARVAERITIVGHRVGLEHHVTPVPVRVFRRARAVGPYRQVRDGDAT
jgi:hypothetical protein